MKIDLDHSFYDMSAADSCDMLDVGAEEGLSSDEATQRKQKFGPNQLQEEASRSPWLILLDQFRSIVILILVVAAILAFATARFPEGMALVAVTLVNTAIGFFTELKARRSMEALRRLGRQQASVLRDGDRDRIDAEQLVPGDIVFLEEGELIPADIRLVEVEGLRVNEAALTGESVPVNKSIDAVDSNSVLHERTDMLYKGTSISEGWAMGVVTATAMNTELGRIAKLTAEAEEKTTPLQKRLDHLGRKLAWITLGIAALVGFAGLVAGRSTVLMVETAIALGVAAIPEGLPIVATIALARGMWLMARRNALVNQLTAVETLGATSIIFTDKTGTLTENRMRLVKAATPDKTYKLTGRSSHDNEDEPIEGQDPDAADEFRESDLQDILRIGALCANATLAGKNSSESSGDPTEIALLEAAAQKNLPREKLLADMAEVREVSFDPDTMMMATVHEKGKNGTNGGKGFYVAVKGAPRAVLEVCDHLDHGGERKRLDEEDRQHWSEQADDLAGEGLRLLGVADKKIADRDAEVYEHLRFVGLVALEDPVRDEAKEAVEQCQDAGIKVVMVTGDRPDTGRAIGEQVGLADKAQAIHGGELRYIEELTERERRRLDETSVFARVTPEQKLNLVKLLQNEGRITAMTGDGVNDTPALKQADIGVAMGQKGTDAAKQVADMVLRDDSFSTIVEAVRQGRIIYANIRKSVIFMLCTNIAEVVAVAVASLVHLPIPLRPLQILYLNVLTDVLPALALGVGLGGSDVMKRLPRSADEAVLTSHHWRNIAGWSGVVSMIVLAALLFALYFLGFTEKRAVTVSFLTLAFAKLWFVLNLRDRGTSIWKNDVIGNRWIWAAWALCLVLLFVAVYWPPLATLLHTVSPGYSGWSVVLSLSLLPVLLGLVIPGIHFYSAKSGKEDE